MRIADLNTSSLYLRQSATAGSLGTVDATGKLYKATLEKASRRDAAAAATADGEAFVYARAGIKMGQAMGTSNVVLENADGSRFTLDTTGKTVSLVAKGQNIDLYVYTPPANGQPTSSASAVKYSFNQSGVMSATGATHMTAMELSAAEIATRRDLDGNTKVGGALDTSSVGGKRVATAGIFKLNVMGNDLFVVGSSTLEKKSNINAQNSTLLNADGTVWSPNESMPGKTFNTFRAVNNSANSEWEVYATDNTGEVTRFNFDATTLQLKNNGIKTLEGKDLVAAEVSNKRDLNVDGKFGAEITETTDAIGKLYKANVAGTTVYLSKVADTKTDTTGGKAVSAEGSLLKADGTAWAGAGTGYKIAAIVSGTKTVNGAQVATRTVYAHGQNGNTADHNDVLKFSFTATASGGNFSLDGDTSVGVKVDATELASAEKSAKRDLNLDGKFGVDITSTVDGQGGLYQGSILGKTFLIAGSGLKTGTTGSLAQDLSGSLLNADGTAWGPATGYSVASIVPTLTGGNVTGYDAYAYKSGSTPDRTDLLKYSFTASGSNWSVTAATQYGTKVDAKALASAEKASTRDLNGDGKFGLNLTLTPLDAYGGLWKGEVFGQSYVLADASASLNSSANGALDLSKALLNADGTAWNPSEISAASAKLRVVVDNTVANAASKYTVYVTTQQGTANATYSKYTFDDTFTQRGNKVSLTTEQFAAAEKTAGKDLNADEKFGVNITEALDSRGGLYKGSLDGSTGVYFKGSANLTPGSKVAGNALNFDTALKTSSGYWTPDTGFTTTAALTDANANTFTVYAKDNTNAVKKYVFDSNNNYTLRADLSGDVKLTDMVALEMAQATPRDLNGDGITGVQSSSTPPDSVGGLFSLTAGGSTVLAVGTGANHTTAPTDLSTMLKTADGSAWSATGSVDRYTLVSSANSYTVYTKVGSNYTEYTFGSDYKIDTTKTRSTLAANDASGSATLDDIKLADLEKSLSRDINGDSALGAQITSTLVTDKVYQASFNGNSYTVVNTTAGITNTALGNKALLNADGSRWTGTGHTIKGATINADSSTEIYTSYTSGGSTSYKRLTFGVDGKLLKDDIATAEQVADSGALGTLSSNAADSTGGLFKATVLGTDYFVVGSGNNNGTAPTDLSRALMLGNTGTAAAWSPLTGTGSTGAGTAGNPAYQVGGLVTNKTGNNVDSYDVYVYANDSNGAVTDVFKSSWDASFNYQGTTRADPLALVEVERTTQRDLNKDGAFGFKLVQASSPESTYKGVSVAKVGGSSMTFLLAGNDLNPGTAAAALSLNSALLNEAGSAAWTPDANYVVTSVADGAANSNLRYVYAKKAGTGGAADEYMRYAFSTVSGKSQGAGTAMTAQEMAAEELTRSNSDLDADGQVGAVSISAYKVSANNSTSTGLLQASYGNQTYFATGSLPAVGAKMNLSTALVQADGKTPWAADSGYTVTAAVTTANANTVVYARKAASGGNPEQYLRYEFNSSTGKSQGAGVAVTSVEMAKAELGAAGTTDDRDLNGDSTVGAISISQYKVGNNTTSTGLLQATVGSQTYFVANTLPAAGTPMDLSKALLQTDGSTPWAVDSGYSVTGTGDGPANSGLRYVYAKKTSGSGPEFQRYSFDTTTNKVVGSAVEVSAVDLAAAEVAGSKDLNGDNQTGALSISAYKVGNNDTSTGLLNASFGSTSFLVAAAMPAAGSSIDLSKALKQADGSTPFAADTGYTITAAVTTSGTSTKVYARKAAAGSDPELYIRYEFDETTGKSLGAGVAVSSVEMAKAELGAAGTTDDKDFNGDNQYGAISINEYKLGNNTTSTGLLQAKLGTQTYLVADAVPAVGARMDLGKALLQADGKTPWAVAAGYTATGAVTSGSDVYVYARKDSGAGAEFQRYTFSTSTYEVQGSPTDISAVDLAAAEVTATKDLNGDNKVGATAISAYKVGTNDTSTGLLNATFGAQSFLVVDSMPAAGTNINLSKALKAADGTTPWAVPAGDTGYTVKAAMSTASGFSVYAATSGNAYKRYDFDSTGKTLGAGVAVTMTEMAKAEIGAAGATDDKDLNGDNLYGAVVTVSDYPVYDGANPTSRSTGLLKASMGGQTFFVVKDAANTTAGVDLKKALLDTSGAAWSLPAGFVVRGTYENASSTSNVLEVYGTTTAGNGAVSVYQFKKQTDANGTFTGAYQLVSGTATTLSGTASAAKEYGYNSNAGADLNGDGVVGFKSDTTADFQESAKFTGAYTLDKASLGGSEIYYVTTDYATAKSQTSGALVKAGALMVDNGGTLAYWTPPTVGTSTFTLKSLSHTGSGATAKVEVWADKSTGGTSDGLVRFVFSQVSSNWVLDAAQYTTDIGGQANKGLTALQIAADEAGSGRAFTLDSSGAATTTAYTPVASRTGYDLNGDGVVGISVTQVTTGSNLDSNVYSTSIGGTTYYLAGTNLSSGTEANPLALDPNKILMTDATTVWAPGGTVTAWSVLDPLAAAAAKTAGSLTNTPQYAATVSGVANPVYFTVTGGKFIKTT